MGKKKGKRYQSPSAVAPERVAELRAALDAGTLADVGDDEAVALATHLADSGAAASLVALQAIAQGKVQRKAVNQALYKLEQRGVEVPAWRERAEGIQITAAGEPISDLPLLMNEPYTNGARLFLMPHQSGRLLHLLQVKFEHPIGLQTLRSSEVGRASYRNVIKNMLASAVVEGTPAAVRGDDALRLRKLWEIGRCVHANRTGTEVDHGLVSELRWPEEEPPHPALALDLDSAEPMGSAELTDATRMAAAFIGEALWNRLEAGMAEAGESTLILSEATEAERLAQIQYKAVEEWVATWQLSDLTEVFLDAALFHAAAGSRREARTLRDVVMDVAEPDLHATIVSFLAKWVGALFSEPESTPDEPGPSGLIVP